MKIFVVGYTGDPYEGPEFLRAFSTREAAAKYALGLVGKVSFPGHDALANPDPQFDLHYDAENMWIDGPYSEGDDLTEKRNRVSAEDL